MTAQLPAATYAFPPLLAPSYHHDPAPVANAPSETSTHDTTRPHNLDTTPLSSTATPSSSYFSHSFASPPVSNLDELPKLGSIRCYWTILSPSLDYVYLDPLLEQHLGEFADQFLGSNLLDFVHPDERDQLAEDLLPRVDRIAGVETAGVFGSVTRLRYRRLVGILRKLGCRDVPTLPDADKYALDEDYLNLDLTTSWIAGNGIVRGNAAGAGTASQIGQGAVLAFFHVIGDKDHVKNNDLFDRGDWTNWCGVQVDEHRYFTPSRCHALVEVLESITSSPSRPSTSGNSEEDSKSALLASLHGLSSETTEGPPPHVFQILDRNGKTIVSFPTPQDEAGRKRYEVESYAALAREVVARPRGAANAKTSCTKRYRSKHPVMKDSILTTIESVVIMYGSITFACFQTAGIYLTIARKAALGLNQPSMSPQPGSAVNDFNLEDVPATVAKPKEYLGYNKRPSPYGQGPPSLGSPPSKRIKPEPVLSRPRLSIPPSDPTGHGIAGTTNDPSATSRGPYRPSIESEYGTNGGVSPTVASASAILGSISSNHTDGAPSSQSVPPTTSQQRSNDYTYPSSTFPYFRPQGASPGSLYPPPYAPHSHSTSPYQAPQASTNGYFPPTSAIQPTSSHEASFSKRDDVQDPPLLGSPSTAKPDLPPKKADQDGSAKDAKEPKKSRCRPEGPIFKPGIKACESCGTTESPEWRKGPSGSKSLCNACGLRYARTVARQKKLSEQPAKDGAPVKKKKGKKALKAENSTTAPGEPASAATETSSLPATSSAHTTYEPAFSRSDSAYAPFYTAAPPHSSSYALVASHLLSSSGPSTSSSSVSTYPASTSGYYPATTTYPYSSYPPTSAPILTHIPIHHTLAATLAPLSAPVSIHSHDYARNGPHPTAIPHSTSFSSTSDYVHALSQAPANSSVYSHRYHHPHSTTSVGGDWPTSFTLSEMHPPASSAAPAPPPPQPMYSSASPHHGLTSSHSTSPHLRHPQPTSYQPYHGWNSERHDSARDEGEGAGGPPN